MRTAGQALMHARHPVVVAALLFGLGVYGVLRAAQRDPRADGGRADAQRGQPHPGRVRRLAAATRLHAGQVVTLFVIVLAAAEIGLGLAIVLLCLPHARDAIDGRRGCDDLRDRRRTEPDARSSG